MILVITRINVLPEKHLELLQAFAAMAQSIRMEKGCQHCEFSRSIEDENRLFLLEEWDTQENLMAHEKSEHFKVLRGVLNILTEHYERTFNTEFHPKEMEEILALRLPALDSESGGHSTLLWGRSDPGSQSEYFKSEDT